MHLQSLKVMFLEEMCMKIPVKAHKPWFIYTGISKYKSESVHKHWSFHTYMQAKYTKSNTLSEHDLCKNMYSNCRPPSRHTWQSISTLMLLAKYFYSINWKIYQKVGTNNSARNLTPWSIKSQKPVTSSQRINISVLTLNHVMNNTIRDLMEILRTVQLLNLNHP